MANLSHCVAACCFLPLSLFLQPPPPFHLIYTLRRQLKAGHRGGGGDVRKKCFRSPFSSLPESHFLSAHGKERGGIVIASCVVVLFDFSSSSFFFRQKQSSHEYPTVICPAKCLRVFILGFLICWANRLLQLRFFFFFFGQRTFFLFRGHFLSLRFPLRAMTTTGNSPPGRSE